MKYVDAHEYFQNVNDYIDSLTEEEFLKLLELERMRIMKQMKTRRLEKFKRMVFESEQEIAARVKEYASGLDIHKDQVWRSGKEFVKWHYR